MKKVEIEESGLSNADEAAARRLVFFDFETGGLEDHHPNIQLAAIATDGHFQELESVEWKIQFDTAFAAPEALKLNHYDAEIWKQLALPERRVVEEFGNFLRRHATLTKHAKASGRPYKVALLAGHNVTRFDAPRLVQMFKRYSMFLPAEAYKPLDTLALAAWSQWIEGDGPSRSLSELCRHYGIEVDSAHEALCDVRMSAKLAKLIFGRLRTR